jgi:hypothetical protein
VTSYPGFIYVKDEGIYYNLEFCDDVFMMFDMEDNDVRFWPLFKSYLNDDNIKKIFSYDCSYRRYTEITEKFLHELCSSNLNRYKQIVTEWKKNTINKDFVN